MNIIDKVKDVWGTFLNIDVTMPLWVFIIVVAVVLGLITIAL